jgi:hypothetical protein
MHADDNFGLDVADLLIISGVVAGYTYREIARHYMLNMRAVRRFIAHAFKNDGLGRIGRSKESCVGRRAVAGGHRP